MLCLITVKENMYISNKLYIYAAAALIGIVIVLCAGLSVNGLVQAEVNSDKVFFIIIFIALLSFVALGLIFFSIKVVSKKPIEEVHALLKRTRDENGLVVHPGNESGEIVVAFSVVIDELHKLLQSFQVKTRAINGRMDVLNEGIRQIAADQTNLFSLNAAIESVRLRQDGFSVISGEILSLVERTKFLTSEVREMGNQIRMEGDEFMNELEHAVRRIDPNQPSSVA